MKRDFSDPWPLLIDTEENRNDFMRNACDNLRPDQEMIPDWAQIDPGYALVVSAPFGEVAFRFGMQQICGCTILYVVSRKRVYLGECLQIPSSLLYNISAFLGYYWEDVSFGKEKRMNYKPQFDKQVTEFLTGGFKAPSGPGRLSEIVCVMMLKSFQSPG